MPPTGAWRSLNRIQHQGCGGPHLGLLIGKATLAGFLTRKAEMRGMCGAQHLMIKDIVNILIPYPNYGFWQRAADPSNVSVSPHARLIANASASHRARMTNGVSVSCF